MRKLWWTAPLMLLACSDRVEWAAPTQVMARITSDATTFEQLSVSVFTQQQSGWAPVSVKTFAPADVRWPHDVAIVPKAGSARDHMFEVVVELKGGGAVLAKQRKLATFVPHQQRVLSVDLWTRACNGASPVCEPNDACHGEVCPTCIGGSCVAAPHERDLPPLVGTNEVAADAGSDLDANGNPDTGVSEDTGVAPDTGAEAATGLAADTGAEAATNLDPCAAGTSGCTGSCVSEAGSYRCTCAGSDTLAADGKTCRTQTWGSTQTLSAISGSYISISMNAAGTAYAVWNEPGTNGGVAWNDLRGSLCTSYTCAPPTQVGAGAERNQGLFAHVTSAGAVSWTGAYSDSAGLNTIKARRAPAYAEQTIGSYQNGSVTWFFKAPDAPYVMYYAGTDNPAPGLHTFVGKPDGTWSELATYGEHFGDYGSFVAFDSGTVMVTWGEASGAYWMSRLSAGVWSPAVKLGTAGATLKPTRAVLDATGVAHLFYAADGTIHHTRVSEAGTTLSMDDVVLPTGAGVANFYASAGTSNVALAWHQGASSLGVSTWSAARGWKTTILQDLASGSPNGTPSIALSRNDLTVQTVWGLTPLGAGKQFVFSQSNDLGNTWSSPATVVGSETPSKDVATDHEGRLMLTWAEFAKPDGSGATRVRFFR
jgi:hypothetical protein